MKHLPTKKELIAFEKRIADAYEKGEIPYPIHFSLGAENHTLKVFKKIKEVDWVFGSHRPHYMALCKGMPAPMLEKIIRRGDSMHVFSKKYKIYSSGIVAGHIDVALGVAQAIKLNKTNEHVWAFIGDGGIEECSFYPAYRYAKDWNLPITFVIENNLLSVSVPLKERHKRVPFSPDKHLMIFNYKREYPHVGTNKWVKFM